MSLCKIFSLAHISLLWTFHVRVRWGSQRKICVESVLPWKHLWHDTLPASCRDKHTSRWSHLYIRHTDATNCSLKFSLQQILEILESRLNQYSVHSLWPFTFRAGLCFLSLSKDIIIWNQWPKLIFKNQQGTLSEHHNYVNRLGFSGFFKSEFDPKSL